MRKGCQSLIFYRAAQSAQLTMNIHDQPPLATEGQPYLSVIGIFWWVLAASQSANASPASKHRRAVRKHREARCMHEGTFLLTSV